jgi:hypothetical protein
MIAKFIEGIKACLRRRQVGRENSLIAVVVFLLILASFGIGFMLGARIYQPCSLNILP